MAVRHRFNVTSLHGSRDTTESKWQMAVRRCQLSRTCCVCICVYACVCMYVRMNVCMCACICVCACVCVRARAYVCMFAGACVRAYVCTCAGECVVRTFLKVYMELGSYFLFLQEQIKDIICMHLCVRVCVCLCVCARMCVSFRVRACVTTRHAKTKRHTHKKSTWQAQPVLFAKQCEFVFIMKQ